MAETPTRLGLTSGVVPNDFFISDLFQNYLNHPQAVVIRDPQSKIEASHEKFLRDVLNVRSSILTQLPHSTIESLMKHDVDVIVGVIFPPFYEFLVTFIAVFSLGAAVVPMSPS